MNDLGLAMAWRAVQVSLLLIPSVALYALAVRRSPDTRAWVASWSLGLVIAFSLLAFAPRGHRGAPATTGDRVTSVSPPSGRGGGLSAEPGTAGENPDHGWSMAALGEAWERVESTAAAPAARCRRWGSVLASFALVGAGGGLLHLIAGLGAIHLCVRRSQPVDDPGMNDLVRELRTALGCRRPVGLHETSELTTPATAGWRRPVLLLPDDWRSWDECDRRAVVSHELAHICRNDYMAGVAARLALALHFYHPVVHWLAARLTLEQELAADALGARFAGGKASYLQSLSRLALRQEGRSPCWPARAFLPAKRTLIRRIVMLRDENLRNDRPWSAPRRTATALLMLAVTGGVMALRGPAFGDDLEKQDDAVKVAKAGSRPDDTWDGKPFDLTYLPDGARSFVAFRPAATFRRAGMGAYRTMLNLWIAQAWSKAGNAIGFDPSQPGLAPLRVEMFEEVMTLFSIAHHPERAKPNRSIMMGDVISARTTEPVDWLSLCRAFRLEPTEVHEGNLLYYKLNAPQLGPDGCLYLPDARTFVFADERRMKQLLRRTTPVTPVFSAAKDWDRSLGGLFVFAFDSRDGFLRKLFLDDPDNLDLPNLFKDGGLLTFSLANQDTVVVNGGLTLADAGAGESTSLAVPTFLGSLQQAMSQPGTDPATGEVPADLLRMSLDLLKSGRVDRDGRSVMLRFSGQGTLADYASVFLSGINDVK